MRMFKKQLIQRCSGTGCQQKHQDQPNHPTTRRRRERPPKIIVTVRVRSHHMESSRRRRRRRRQSGQRLTLGRNDDDDDNFNKSHSDDDLEDLFIRVVRRRKKGRGQQVVKSLTSPVSDLRPRLDDSSHAPSSVPLMETGNLDEGEEDDEEPDEDPVLFEYDSAVCGNGTIPICASDIMCLQPDGAINSAILDFWISLLHHDGRIQVKDQERILVFSSEFYPYLRQSLKKRRRRGGRGTPAAPISKNKAQNIGLSWTNGVDDLFLRDFIFLPIVLEAHWLLAVICYPGMVPQFWDVTRDENRDEDGTDNLSKLRLLIKLRRDRNDSPTPMILIFDSLQSYGIYHNICASLLRRFLNQEWVKRYPWTRFIFTQSNLPLYVLDVPQQNNGSECGLFLLRFFEKFFTSPLPRDEPFPASVYNEWSKAEDQYLYYGMREEIYDKICELVINEDLDDEGQRAVLIPIIKFPKLELEVKEENNENGEED